MSTAEALQKACLNDAFPSLATMMDFGMTGHDPVSVFGCYQLAVKYDHVDAHMLNAALKTKTINELLKKCPTGVKSDYYQRIGGSVQTVWDKLESDIECLKCNYYGACTETGNCPNCEKSIIV